jgi:hypothetical protein
VTPDPPDPETNQLYRQLFEAAKGKLRMELKLVSPPLARTWLEAMAPNRSVSNATVARFTVYMEQGKWRVNGEPIIRSADDLTLDGRHRLLAITRTGLSVPMVIITGVDKEAFKSLNQGRARTGSDTLSAAGKANSRVLASALHWLQRYETQTILARGTPLRLSNEDYLDLLRDFPAVEDSLRWVSPRCRRGLHPPGPTVFLHYACMKQHPDREDFFVHVLDGTGLERGTPEYILSRKLEILKDRGGRCTGGKAVAYMAYVVRAWNASVTGQALKKLDDWGLGEQRFPEIL